MHREWSGHESDENEPGQSRALRLDDAHAPANLYTARVENGTITSVAAGEDLVELLGYSPEALESDRSLWTDFVHPQDKPRVCESVERLLQGQPIFEIYRLFREDGQMQWVWHAAAPTLDRSGRVVRIFGMLCPSDPPELLPERLPQCRVMLDNVPFPISMRGTAGRVIYCNNACAVMFGYECSDDTIGTSYADIIAPDFYEEFESVILPKILAGGWNGELKLRRRDGALRYVQAAITLLRDDKGVPTATYAVLMDVTERKLAEAALLSTDSLLRQFVENAPAAVAMFDKDMRYLLVSKRWLADYGIGDQNIIGRSHYEVFPEVPERWKRIHQRVLSGHIQKCEEDSFIRINGEPEWVRWELRPWIDDTGQIGGLIMYTEVITQRKRAEQALRESRELLNVIQDSLPAEVAVLDRDGNIIAVNKSWEVFARENGDPSLVHTGVGVNYLDVCRRSAADGCEDARVTLEGLQSVLNGSAPDFQMEYACPSTRRLFWFWLRSAPLLSESGGAVVSHTDVTDRKIMEEALRAGEEKYRTLVESVDAIVSRMDAKQRPIMIAGNVEGITGRTADEIMREPNTWTSNVYPDDRQRLISFLESLRDTRQPGSIDFRVIRHGNEVRWLRSHIRPKFNEHGEPLYFDGITTDVTERVQALHREQRHMARVAALAQISRAVAGSLDADTIVDTVARQTATALQCLCVVFSRDRATDRLYPAAIMAENELRESTRLLIHRVDYHLPPDIGASPPVITDLLPENIRPEHRAQIGPSIVLPVYVEGKAFGLIVAVRTRGAEEFEDDDIWFLTEVASFVSAALTNASLYRRQTRIAETLQRSLIPISQDVPCLDIATCYLPAIGEAEVGGDFFDIIHISDCKVGVVVGDVSGKGMEAAIHTAEAKYMLRGYAVQNPDPGFVMTALNEALWKFTSEFTFVTLVYVLIDTQTHTVAYVNAGHEPPLALRRDECTVHEYLPQGPALGIIKDAQYTSAQGRLEADDLLLCYTDGVTDVPRDGERFGYDRLVETVALSNAQHPSQLLDTIVDTISDFGHGKQPDDQVIVVVGPK